MHHSIHEFEHTKTKGDSKKKEPEKKQSKEVDERKKSEEKKDARSVQHNLSTSTAF